MRNNQQETAAELEARIYRAGTHASQLTPEQYALRKAELCNPKPAEKPYRFVAEQGAALRMSDAEYAAALRSLGYTRR